MNQSVYPCGTDYQFVLLTFALCLVFASRGVAAELHTPSTEGEPTRIDFERQVAPLFARLGCNGSSCHGAAKGKGGFRLSLFGYDPVADYVAVTHQSRGRRVHWAAPSSSLLLRKPTLEVPHGGGQRLARDSWEYRVLERWIAAGTPHVPGSGRVERVVIEPSRRLLREPGQTERLCVMVTFADGKSEDMTAYCEFRSQDESIVGIEADGTIRAVGSGDTAVIAIYRGQPASARVLVPRTDGALPVSDPHELPLEENLVDRFVLAKLRELGIQPSQNSSDEEFLRRVALATTGQLPAPQEIREFLGDPHPDKRSLMIDRLLEHPLHAALWATRLCDMTGSTADTESDPALRPKREKMWHDWFRSRLAKNVPWDEIVTGVLCATSRDGQSTRDWISSEASLIQSARNGFDFEYADRATLDLFWRQTAVNEEIPVEDVAERIAAAFLGIRLECAHCHKHPFDHWTQSDYRAYTNIFTQVRFGMSPAARAELAAVLEEGRQAGAPVRRIPPLREVYLTAAPQDGRDPVSGEVLPPRPPGGGDLPVDGDRRVVFAKWLTAADNPYFAPNFVNRVWAFYFGTGLVAPLDAFSAANPPTHPELLAALARSFAESGYDIRKLEQLILSSRVWQLSSIPNDTNRTDRHNFARSYPRIFSAEVLVDTLQNAIGDRIDAGSSVPAGARAVEIAPRRTGQEEIDRIFEIFRRSDRRSTCDCEPPREPTLRQAMLLLSDPKLLTRIRQGRLVTLLERSPTDGDLMDELFLATLSRYPTNEERSVALAHIQAGPDRSLACAEVMWSLINTREFVTNH